MLENGTDLLPAVEQVAAAPGSRCRTVLTLVSDGVIAGSDPDRLLTALTAAGVDDVVLLRPSPNLPVPEEFTQLAPYADSSSFDGLDPGATGVALGQVLAKATGQRLQHR